MYTKECHFSLFGEGCITTYYKDGDAIADSLNNGNIIFIPTFEERYTPITRAKAYRYWKKHFPDRLYWALPELLADATQFEAEFKCVKNDIAYYG